MLRFWFHFHPLIVLVSLFGVFVLSALCIHWVQCLSSLHDWFRKRELGMPTFVAISALFALFAGFLLAQTIERKDHAMQAVYMEGEALLALALNSETVAPAIHAPLRNYVHSVVTDEWPLLQREQRHAETEAAALALMRVLRDEEGLSPVIHAQSLDLVHSAMTSRAARIALVTNHIEQLSWPALFALGFLTQFILGMGYLDRPRSNMMAIMLFSFSAVVALWLIAIQDNPFNGPYAVSVLPIERVLAHL